MYIIGLTVCKQLTAYGISCGGGGGGGGGGRRTDTLHHSPLFPIPDTT